MADKLTKAQAQAVNDRGGKLLVSAAAGSGKTKVLVDRLLKYLTDPVSPANLDEFLIITYTKAAASELRAKIAAKLSERIAEEPENKHLQKQMQRLFLTKISTVHGFCSDILREYAYRLDLAADFRVADENECREIRETVLLDLLDEAYRSAGNEPAFRAFVDTQGLGRDDRLVPDLIEKVYDSARCHLDPEGWLARCLTDADVEDLADVSQTRWGAYLMEDLREYLACQIAVMEQCAEEADKVPGFEKVSLNLRATLNQLRSLHACETWDQVVSSKEIDYGRLTFPRKCEAPELAERIKAARAACKKGMEKKLRSFANPSELVLSDLRQASDSAQGLIWLVRQFDAAYSRAKRSRRCVDFGDLEHMTLDLLLGKSRSGPTAAAAEIGARFREIMVDEYQDSNGVQDAIFAALTGKKQNCFMVGDVKQSIYQFRLADPGIFLEKYNTYVPAEEARAGEGRKVLLSHNFRSGGEIVEAVNHVFRTCMTPAVGGLYYGDGEALREGIPHEPIAGAVELHALDIRQDTYGEEAAFTAQRIRELLDAKTPVRCPGGFRPVQPEDIVILLRSPGSVGGQFQQALERLGIRCASGGGTDLLETEEIATLRALLLTIYNPRQDIPLVSVLASPVFGFTADELADFRSRRRGGCVYDALVHGATPKSEAFLETLNHLRRTARMHTLTQLLQECLYLTRMDSIYAAMPGGEARRANLQTFYQLAADFEMGNHRDLGQFLDHLQAMEAKGLVSAGAAPGGCVTIMSIHKSKGLEFPVVFLCGLSRSFNREDVRSQILCEKELGIGLSAVDTGNRVRYPTLSKRAIAVKMVRESLSEEMRVLYVAMTRARDRLIMTYASNTLEKDLQEIALRMDFDGGALICRDVVCPGEWVLLAAMGRMEAGALFAIGGRPLYTEISEMPWKIAVSQAPDQETSVGIQEKASEMLPDDTLDALKTALSFRYAHITATQTPSKQTATQRKGRMKDAEAAEDTREPKPVHRSWRKPSFLGSKLQGKDYGSAMHAALQYIRYEACTGPEEIREEIARLVREGFLTEAQGSMVDCERLSAFFATDYGRKLTGGTPYIREFKFSILDEGEHYGDHLEGEKVLLQGVVDCALMEEDGITILDFKTDRVTETTLPDIVARYSPQVRTYSEALSRIYGMPVKAQYLYLVGIDRFVEV